MTRKIKLADVQTWTENVFRTELQRSIIGRAVTSGNIDDDARELLYRFFDGKAAGLRRVVGAGIAIAAWALGDQGPAYLG